MGTTPSPAFRPASRAVSDEATASGSSWRRPAAGGSKALISVTEGPSPIRAMELSRSARSELDQEPDGPSGPSQSRSETELLAGPNTNSHGSAAEPLPAVAALVGSSDAGQGAAPSKAPWRTWRATRR